MGGVDDEFTAKAFLFLQAFGHLVEGVGQRDYLLRALAGNAGLIVAFKPGIAPYLLTSAQAVQTAAAAGHVTVTRVPAADFRCPVQP